MPNQGNLLRGIVNWSGAVLSVVQVLLTTVFVANFLYFNLKEKPIKKITLGKKTVTTVCYSKEKDLIPEFSSEFRV